jgi:hypothetical protein
MRSLTDKHFTHSGLLVQARPQYLVEDFTPPPDVGSQTLLNLSCVDDDSQGTGLYTLWDSEDDAQILQANKDITKMGFDSTEKFSAYLHTVLPGVHRRRRWSWQSY